MRAWAPAALLALALGAPAAADWRDDVGTLRIGVVAIQGAPQTRLRFEPFRAFVAVRTQLAVELVTVASAPALIDAHATGRVDYAVHTASGYATAARRCGCIEPIAAPVAPDGTAGFHALLVTSAQAEIGEVADLAGKRLAVGAPDSLTARLAALQALEEAGLDPQTGVELVEGADPADTVTMVLTGEADAAATWSSLAGDPAGGYSFGALRELVDDGLMTAGEIRIVWRSPLIPFGPHAIRSDAPRELKILLLDVLRSLEIEAPEILDAVDAGRYGGGGFRPIGDEAYAFADRLSGGR